MEVPDLFSEGPEAERRYGLLLCHLMLLESTGRLSLREANTAIVEVIEAIRGSASESGADTRFTHIYERDALWYLNRHDENWTRQLRFETDLYGAPVELNSTSVPEIEMYFAAEARTPLHYACGRYAESAQCKELKIGMELRGAGGERLLNEVLNLDEVPTHPVRVTLAHIYAKLGKSLGEWSEWSTFLRVLPDSLFVDANITREQVCENPADLVAMAMVLERRAEEIRRNVSMTPPDSSREAELMKWFPFLKTFPKLAWQG